MLETKKEKTLDIVSSSLLLSPTTTSLPKMPGSLESKLAAALASRDARHLRRRLPPQGPPTPQTPQALPPQTPLRNMQAMPQTPASGQLTPGLQQQLSRKSPS